MKSTPEKRLQQFEACVFYFSTSLSNGSAAAVPGPANVSRQHVAEPEAIAFNFLAGYDGNFPVEHRPRICKGMEFAIFAAGIDIRGKIAQEFLVKVASNKAGGYLFRIHADKFRSQPGAHHLPRQRLCGNPPDRKQRFQSGVFQLALSVGPYVGEKKVAKRDGGYTLRQRVVADPLHGHFIVGIRAGPRNGCGAPSPS